MLTKFSVPLLMFLLSANLGDCSNDGYVQVESQEQSDVENGNFVVPKTNTFWSESSSRKEREIQNECDADHCKNEILRIPKGYNFFEVPFQPKVGNFTPAINVTMKARVEKIRDIDEVKEEITLDMEITLGWTDWKILAHRKNLSISQIIKYIENEEHTKRPAKLVTLNNPEYLKTIWKPNLYIYDLIEKTQPKLMSDLITLHYDPEGGFIYYLTRVILKLSCPMEFQYYPTDTQQCKFKIRGFSYNEDLLNLKWYKPPFLASRDQSNFDVQLNAFAAEKINVRDDIFNGLSFNLLLRRKLSYHVVQTYIPSSFFIIITWLCLLIPSTMVEARIGISMTTLLTLTAMFASVRETSPVSAYVKALDIWMVSCIFSVFLTLFEFTLLTWLRHLESTNAEQLLRKSQLNDAAKYIEQREDGESLKSHTDKVSQEASKILPDDDQKFSQYVLTIEKFAFPLFFVIFVIFNAVYWTWLFRSSGFLRWPQVNDTLNAHDTLFFA